MVFSMSLPISRTTSSSSMSSTSPSRGAAGFLFLSARWPGSSPCSNTGSRYGKGAAAADLRFHFDAAVVILDDLLDDGQALAGAAALTFGGEKRLEDLVLVFPADAEAVVADLDERVTAVEQIALIADLDQARCGCGWSAAATFPRRPWR